MTVALLGVGFEPSNCSPTPPVYEDGTFEYIPQAESAGSAGTSEPRTFGNTRLRNAEGVMADYLDSVRPRGDDGPEIEGVQLANWPLHYDPNFQARTFGETGDRGDHVEVLRALDPGDGVAFYTVLEPVDGGGSHRYLIGHFEVAAVVDLQDVDGTAFGDLPADQRQSLMDDHAENAHAKRFDATGDPPEDDDLVIVDGTDPGTLLAEAVQISEHGGGGHYYLTDDLQERLSPRDGDDEKNAYLGGSLQAHLLDVDHGAILDLVE